MAIVGRLAPSPTGLMHIGNLRSLVLAWLAVRATNGRIYLRIEDLLADTANHTAALIDDLRWLGLDWDPPPSTPVSAQSADLWAQSQRESLYAAVVDALIAAQLAYPCICTRKDVELAATAPHAEDMATAYAGTCRGRYASVVDAQQDERARAHAADRAPMGVAVRLCIPEGTFAFVDLIHGQQVVNVAATAGDLVIRRKDGGFAYMLAVVVDDIAMGVNQVVRGDDLLAATGQQLAVYRQLMQCARLQAATHENQQFWQLAAIAEPPSHAHVSLVVGDEGRRLAKRNKSMHLRSMRDRGVTASAVRAWILASCGQPPATTWYRAAAVFDWAQVPRSPVVFGHQELATLVAEAQIESPTC
ncbi:MAG: tRNA glutamyl-Q(34) synthetase GluQRS [Myxococcales bacterium]|nr:tRNA glutamyl-Q(34) synthetase GluQRS [Myxococcales bacterium]